MRVHAAAVGVLLLLAAPAAAQPASATPAPAARAPATGAAAAASDDAPPSRRLELLLSGAWGTEVKTRLGVRHDRDLFILALRGGWTLVAGPRASLEYTADVVPLVVATGNRAYEEAGTCPETEADGCPYSSIWNPERYTAYAAGLAPIGLRMRVRLARRLDATLGGSGGALLFSRAVPDMDETRFNWTAEWNSGLAFAIEPRVALVLGYRYHHISNGGRGPVNPGIDTHLLAVGLERRR
ncbi:MAG TPA: acyloxyacyl hydrolase [Gemmatimonadaceae bacterium]|nr:acyloxyacyl hydrolase [Gemmatimonadaceae bacterium]